MQWLCFAFSHRPRRHVVGLFLHFLDRQSCHPRSFAQRSGPPLTMFAVGLFLPMELADPHRWKIETLHFPALFGFVS
jgi:hypothetical protein